MVKVTLALLIAALREPTYEGVNGVHSEPEAVLTGEKTLG
jgi:hypothetical protein